MRVMLRFWFALLCLWLFLLYNVERLYAPINLASFVYPFTAACAVITISFRRVWATRLVWLLVTAIGLFLLLKLWRGYPIGGMKLPLTIMEGCVITVTISMAVQIGRCISIVEDAARDVLLRHYGPPAVPFEEAQSEMYRELRRARHHQRPVAMVTAVPETGSLKASLNRLLEELQQKAVAAYVNARIAELAARHTKDCDIISNNGQMLLIMLPEATSIEAEQFASQLQEIVKQELGLTLKLGISTFPEEEVTLVGLIEHAITTPVPEHLAPVAIKGAAAHPANGESFLHTNGKPE